MQCYAEYLLSIHEQKCARQSPSEQRTLMCDWQADEGAATHRVAARRPGPPGQPPKPAISTADLDLAHMHAVLACTHLNAQQQTITTTDC